MVNMLKRARDVIAVEGTEGRNPFEQLMLAWSVLASLSWAFGSPTPGSVEAVMKDWMVAAWYITLCIGGLAGLVGVWLKNLILSLLVERAAMLVVGPAGLIYAIAIFAQVSQNPRALAAGGIVLFYALAAFWRGYRVQTYLRKLRATLAKAAEG